MRGLPETRRDQARRRPARDRKSRRRQDRRRRPDGHGRRHRRSRAPIRCASSRGADPPLLGRSARPERRDHRHGLGGRLFPIRARRGLHRHGRPPGQRLSDHRRVLEGAEPAHRGIRQARQVRLSSRLRMVRQHRHGRRPQHLLSPRRPADPPLVAHPGRGPDLDGCDLHRRQAVRMARRTRTAA